MVSVNTMRRKTHFLGNCITLFSTFIEIEIFYDMKLIMLWALKLTERESRIIPDSLYERKFWEGFLRDHRQRQQYNKL